MTAVKLTAKETALMTAIADRKFSFFDQGLVAGSGIWFEVMGQEIAGSTEYPVSDSVRGVATVASSLGRKGLLVIEAQTGSVQNSEGAWMALSEAGAAWCAEFNAVDNATTAAVLAEAREGREEAPAAAEEAPAPAATPEAPVAAPAAAEAHTPASPETMVKKQARLASLKARLAAATERRVARGETDLNITERTLTNKIAGVEKFIATHSA